VLPLRPRSIAPRTHQKMSSVSSFPPPPFLQRGLGPLPRTSRTRVARTSQAVFPTRLVWSRAELWGEADEKVRNRGEVACVRVSRMGVALSLSGTIAEVLTYLSNKHTQTQEASPLSTAAFSPRTSPTSGTPRPWSFTRPPPRTSSSPRRSRRGVGSRQT